MLLCGLDGSGKTTFLYSYVIVNFKEFIAEETIGMFYFIMLGFNYEILKEKDDSIGFWDVGGKSTVIIIKL